MESKRCMNFACAASTSIQWRQGWALRSGAFALLCDNCGSAFEQSKFCDVFHSNEAGWRPCSLCGKRLHCGCIASRSLVMLRDTGGIFCITCSRNSGLEPFPSTEKPNGSGAPNIKNAIELECTLKVGSMQIGDCAETDRMKCWLKPNGVDTNGSSTKTKRDDVSPSIEDLGIGKTLRSRFHWDSNGSSKPTNSDNHKANMKVRDAYESLGRTNSSITPNAPLGNSNSFGSVVVHEREQSKTSPPNVCMATPVHVARPPAKRLERNQLLPRYWPRTTDQELLQISGGSNSTIMPLFEKTLTSSDVGRLGRLILPKSCAEGYFPPISQPEGTPLQIQDVKGKIWVFRFRYWPNNSSRIYVLEGVNPCFQSLELQAGDSVTFSLMGPEGKLIMGYRKAPIEDALMLNLTWEEAQKLLRPSVNPSNIVVIDDHEFEEYDEPPIFGKKSIYVNGMNEQWTQCDSCSKWRKLPGYIVLRSKWTCEENLWDPSRCSCSAPCELSPRELGNLLKNNKILWNH